MAPVSPGIEKDRAGAFGGSSATEEHSPAMVALAAKLLRLQSRFSRHWQAGEPASEAAATDAQTTIDNHADFGSLVGVAASLDAEIRCSIRTKDFFYEYQPIVCALSGAVKGYEALVRWRRGGRSVSPAFFLPIAEETRSIIAIQHQLLNDIARVYAELGPEMSLGLNWSPTQLSETQAVTDFINRIHELRIDPRRIVIEITEHTVTLDPGAAYASILRLKDQGFLVALDDFGRGHCGLSYLRRLPVDQIKIDGSLVRDLGESQRSALILDAIVSLAHQLGNEVVAEGVETDRQLSALRYAGCDFLQGHLIGYPSRHLIPDPAPVQTLTRCAPHVQQAIASAAASPRGLQPRVQYRSLG
jgi:EAL domain-containing protein (putative c-di-GMP-specific phosphodiesterase class I)